MKNHLLPAILLGILFLGFQSITSANELYPVSLTQRVNNSTLIAEGKVIAQNSFEDLATGNIYTANQVIVYRTFKGTLQGEAIEIITHGGILGNRMDVYSSYLSLSVGQSGIFFCMPSILKKTARVAGNHTSYMVYSSMQGFIAFDTRQRQASDPFTRYNTIDAAAAAVKQLTKTEMRIRENPETAVKETTTLGVLAAPTITNLSPTTITAGTASVLTITGTNFGLVQGTVEFRNANNGGATWEPARPKDFVSWTDTKIEVRVPSTGLNGSPAGSGQVRVTNIDPASVTSAGSITIPYAYSNVAFPDTAYIPDHININALGGYTLQMETSFAATDANASFRRAMESWTCKTGMNWRVGATTAVNTVAADNISVVRFDVGSELGAGTLGVCLSRYGGCGSPLTWVVTEMDITFDGGRPWQYGPAAPVAPQIDFESVAVHELGHGQQLTHIISAGAVMHYAISAGVQSRNLGAGDINGGNDVTSRGFIANSCGPGPMIAATPNQISSPAGTAGGAQVCLSGIVSGGGTTYADANCHVIARILPSGALPVSGMINVCTKYESGVPIFNSQAYCERHYDIEPASGAATATGTITLYYTQAEFTAYNAANGVFPDLPTGPADAAGIANLRITQYHGTSGTGLPGTYSGAQELIDPADASIVWNATATRWEITFAVTGFSGFFVHTGSSALPLRLLQFSGTISGNSNVLHWTTTAEEQTAYFDIQRSSDGVNFNTIGQAVAAGITAGNNNYEYADKVGNHTQTVYYYRLKMIDNNAQFTYSSIVKLKRSNQEFLVKVLQNPFRQQLLVDVTSPRLQECVVTLTDMNGRNIAQRTVVLQNGNTIINVPGVQNAGAGTYVLTLVTTTEKRVIKVLKQP
jgi:hypothetical protein